MPSRPFHGNEWLPALLSFFVIFFKYSDIMLPQLAEIITRHVKCIIAAFRNLENEIITKFAVNLRAFYQECRSLTGHVTIYSVVASESLAVCSCYKQTGGSFFAFSKCL